MSSVLENEYIEPTRPYSQNELKELQKKLYRKLRLSKHIAYHSYCKHFYRVKKNGHKEKEIIDKKSNNIGNCSVCWKLSKTNNYLVETAHDVVAAYSQEFWDKKNYLTYCNLDLERVFYTWLYEKNKV